MPHVHNALHHFTAVQDGFRAIVTESDPGFTGIERAGETLTPVVNVWDRAEWQGLRAEVPWAAYHEQAAVAAEFGFVGLRNPAGSGWIAVIQHVRAWTDGALMTLTRYQSLVLTTDVDGAEQVSPRDTRFNLAGATPLFKIHGAGAGPIGNESFGRWVLQQNVDRESDPTEQFVIHPGHETRFYLGTANTPLRLTLIGYAYPTVGRALGKL